MLFVTNLYPPLGIGGSEIICADYTRVLTERGHHIAVLTSSFWVDQGGWTQRNRSRRRHALTFTAGNVQQLADKLQWVVENPAEAAQMGWAASEDVRRRFDLPRQVSEFERHVMSAVS
jgi:hypothetical protein